MTSSTMSCLQHDGSSKGLPLNGGAMSYRKKREQQKQQKKAEDTSALFSLHQEQYTSETADFFDIFNSTIKRALSYTSYISASVLHLFPDLNKDSRESHDESIAVDLGCGTGWLTPALYNMGFSKVYGIDTSKSMLGVAFYNTPEELTDEGKVIYRREVPEEIMGKCKLITAVHMLYHFPTEAQLRDNFFTPVHEMLEDNGEIIVVGCPSNFIRNTPDHYFNSIHVDDIPAHVKKNATDLQVFAHDGYIPLSKIPKFEMADGMQMKATLVLPPSCPHPQKKLSLQDTFWSDAKVDEIAKSVGLVKTGCTNIPYEDHLNAYRISHYRKARNVKTLDI